MNMDEPPFSTGAGFRNHPLVQGIRIGNVPFLAMGAVVATN